MQHSYGNGYDTIESLYQFDRFWEANSTLARRAGARRCMIFGHTHRQGIHWLSDDALWVNPGSASYRRPDDPGKDAYYALLSDGQIQLRHVAYDRTPLGEMVAALKPALDCREYTVANFFFIQQASDGPMVDVRCG